MANTVSMYHDLSIYRLGPYCKLKAGLHYATGLQATRRLRKVNAERCCLQRGCMQCLLLANTMQHGCRDEDGSSPPRGTTLTLQREHSPSGELFGNQGRGLLLKDRGRHHFLH